MSARHNNPRLLIVEGYDDLRSVVGLMEHHVDWPNGRENAPVHIEIGESVEKILKQAYLTAQLKTSNLEAIGIMLDADLEQGSRYQQIRTVYLKDFPDLPALMPKEGLIAENKDGVRLGLWIMPDNFSPGIFETFLEHLVPSNAQPIWNHSVEAVSKARTLGAEWKDVQRPKANLYTFLAWQDPPGQSPGISLSRKILDPHCPLAQVFATWFKSLYKLTSTTTENATVLSSNPLSQRNPAI